jgi:DNA-binding transcriptional regulator YiaG
MGRASVRLHAAGDRLAMARDQFLAAQPVDRAVVREPILASWWRSREWNVAADRLRLSYLRAPDLESTLARSADPVLRRLHQQLDGQPISVILTDAAGLVLCRLTGDRDLERHLDGIMLAPGFSYAEDVVGTNGIGTALESGGPAHVFGHEHYAERLEGMACAGSPIRDPVSGKTVGVIDLTCWRKDADPLLMSLVQATATQVSQSLASMSSSRDMHLLQEYLRACRHSGGIVLALGNDIVMLNDHARQALSPPDQAALITRATDALGDSGGGVTVDLPSGTVARIFCRRISADTPCRDGVVHVKIISPATAGIKTASAVPLPREPGPAGTHGPPDPSVLAGTPRPPMALPGLMGSSAAWRRACRDAEAGYDSGEWLTVEGETGAGKLSLIRAVHQRRNPAASFHVVDARNVRDVQAELRDGTGLLVIRRVEAASARDVRALTAALAAAARETGPRVAMTLDRARAYTDLTALLRLFPGTVRVRRYVTTARTSRNWCRSSWPGSASTATSPAPPRRCNCCSGTTGPATSASCGTCSSRWCSGAGRARSSPKICRRNAGRSAAGCYRHWRRWSATPSCRACVTTTATRSAPPGRLACPARRSTGGSTSTASSRPLPESISTWTESTQGSAKFDPCAVNSRLPSPRRRCDPMVLSFRNLTISPDAPVPQWPTEAVQTALERGDLADWHRIVAVMRADPWGRTARQVEEVLSHSRPYGVAEIMETVLSRARERAEARERAAVAAEVRDAIERSGLSRAEFAARIGTSTSRLSTYASGKVTPSATLMLRIHRVADQGQ